MHSICMHGMHSKNFYSMTRFGCLVHDFKSTFYLQLLYASTATKCDYVPCIDMKAISSFVILLGEAFQVLRYSTVGRHKKKSDKSP